MMSSEYWKDLTEEADRKNQADAEKDTRHSQIVIPKDSSESLTEFLTATMSPSGKLWRTWFERLGARAEADVINATATLVIGERDLVIAAARSKPSASDVLTNPNRGIRAGSEPESPSPQPAPEGRNVDRNLAAYTPPGSTYPPYISINSRNWMVEITVRSPEGEDGSCGSLAKVTMNQFHFHKLIDEAKESLG